MPGLAPTGELTYNGYTFDGASHITVEVEFVRDDAQRVITGHKHTITVQAVVASNGQTLDTQMSNIKARLGESRRPLVFRNKGFGNELVVGGDLPSVVEDTNNGPLPKVLSWIPIGDNRAAEITWQVETTTPPCPLGRSIGGRIAAINYEASWSIERGITTRQLSGYIEISPRRRVSTPDAFRQFFSPEAIPGFERDHFWEVSSDRKRVNFTITDSQIPSNNPYPESIITIEGGQSLSWSFGKGDQAGQFTNTISMTISPELGLSGAQAYQVFLTIATQRLLNARQRGGNDPFILGLNIDEDIFGLPQSFRLSYRLLGNIEDFVSVAGLWRPIGTDWRRWVTSLSGSMFNNRGSSRLGEAPGDDVIVSLCAPTGPVQPNGSHREIPNPSPTRRGRLENISPSERTSFLNYSNTLKVYKRSPVIMQSIIQSPSDETGGINAKSFPSGTAPTYSVDQAGISDVIQKSGNASFGVRMAGTARRAGHLIPRPKIETIGSQPAVEIDSEMSQRVVGDALGVPVYDAWWVMDYLVDKPPDRVDPLPNWLFE